jgi:hypothetical protein
VPPSCSSYFFSPPLLVKSDQVDYFRLFTTNSKKISLKYKLIELFFLRARERGVRERGKVK